MSFAIVRVQKFKSTGVKGIQIHNLREKESRTNPDIDKDRSEKNFALVECTDFKAAVKNRLENLNTTKAVRKDAVVMAQVLVTSGPEFFEEMAPEKQRQFFEDSLDFLADRYGKENIFSAVVHMDEKTPHMHVDFTPISEGRLSAKAIFTRSELGQLQTDFAQNVGGKWGLQRGISREDKRKHLDTEAYKIKKRREELEHQAKDVRPEIPQFEPHEVEPQKIGIFKKERSAELAARLNEKLTPLKDMAAQLRTLQGKVQTLEKEVETARPKLEILQWYREAFADGLSKSQRNTILTHANQFRAQNRAEKEKARQEAKEREKQVQERQTATDIFERYFRGVPGTIDQHAEQLQTMMEKWDKSTPEVRKAIVDGAKVRIEQQQKSKTPSMGMRMR